MRIATRRNIVLMPVVNPPIGGHVRNEKGVKMSWLNRKVNREMTLTTDVTGIIKREEVICIDGVVVDEDYFKDTWKNVWEFFYAHGATVGGNAWERKYRKEYVDNGRVYDPATNNWEYTEAAGGNVNPFQCNYEAAQDYQGSVPSWDGYSGE
jgi:hypothetical protein